MMWFCASTAPDTRRPELLTVIVPFVMLVLIRKASLPLAINRAPALLLSVKLPVEKDPLVSMPRVLAVIVPELLMITPGLADPPLQTISVVSDRVPPAAIVP